MEDPVPRRARRRTRPSEESNRPAPAIHFYFYPIGVPQRAALERPRRRPHIVTSGNPTDRTNHSLARDQRLIPLNVDHDVGVVPFVDQRRSQALGPGTAGRVGHDGPCPHAGHCLDDALVIRRHQHGPKIELQKPVNHVPNERLAGDVSKGLCC
jgi:hypothetical protein